MSKFVGFEPTYLSHYTQYFTSDGTTASFPLGVNPGSSSAILVNQDGVIQRPGLDYTVQAGNLVFNSAPAAPATGITNNIFITFLGIMVSIPTPAANSVGTSQVQDGSITNIKMGLTTEAQFDNDTSPATTEFVQRALGNLRGARAITGAATLTLTDIGKFLTCSTGGYTITLPAASTVNEGGSIYFQATTGDITVSRAGTDTITLGNGTAANTVVLKTGDSLLLTWGGASTWAAIGGTVQLPYATGFKTALNATGTAPVYACRAWANFNGTGTLAVRASGNISSITDNGVGDYTLNFATALQDANYSIVGQAAYTTINTTSGLSSFMRNADFAQTTSAARVQTAIVNSGASSAKWDSLEVSVAVFR